MEIDSKPVLQIKLRNMTVAVLWAGLGFAALAAANSRRQTPQKIPTTLAELWLWGLPGWWFLCMLAAFWSLLGRHKLAVAQVVGGCAIGMVLMGVFGKWLFG